MTEASTALQADSNNESRLDQDLAIGACALCVKTAHTLLEDLHENLDTAYRSPGWHTVYFAFAAGTILIAAHICPLISVDFNDQTFQQSWSRCVSVLGYHRMQIKSAERAIGVLEALKERVRKIRVIGTEGDVLNDGQPVQTQSADLNGGISNLGREYNYSNITEYGISGPNNGMADPMQFDIASMGLTNLDSFNDAWFTQQLGDFDWLNSS